MVDLVVNATFDYSSSALLDIARIKFTASGVTATFDASQFDGIAIHDDLIIRGVTGQSNYGVVINGGAVDASHWTFNFWDRSTDTLTFNGTSTADKYYGSSVNDIMFGGQGSDTFNTSDGGGDEFHGEGGKDFFRYKSVAGPITDSIDGGGNTDRLSVGGAGTFDFTGASIVSVEELRFGNANQTVILNYDQIYPFLSGSINKITGSSAVNTLEIHGTSASFSNITVSNWTDGVDTFRIVGTSGQDLLFGSIYGDEIVSAGGNDFIESGDGDDTVEIGADATGANITGGNGTDTLLVVGQAQDAARDLRNISISEFERMAYGGSAAQVTVLIDSQYLSDNALVEIIGGESTNMLSIHGNAVDLTSLTFTDWDVLTDIIILNGSGNENFDLSGLSVRSNAEIFAGLANVKLGEGGDLFKLHGQLSAGSVLDGGGTPGVDRPNRLLIADDAPASLDLSDVTITSISQLEFTDGWAGTLMLSGDQIGGTGSIQSLHRSIASPGVTPAATINVIGNTVDLSSIAFGSLNLDVGDHFIIDGTTGDDILIGSSETDIFNGDIGRDTIYVSRHDEAYGDGANDDFIIDTSLGSGVFEGVINGGAGTADQIIASGFVFLDQATITGVETLFSYGGFIWLRGDQLGASGITTVELDAGTDIELILTGSTIDLSPLTLINFGTGNTQRFKLLGTEGDDSAIGSSVDDFLYGSIGADVLDGGGGVDTVDYLGSNDGVTVKLNNGTFSGGDAEGDVLSNIENVYGSRHDDTLTGDSGDNEIHGDDGDDVVTGGNGTDLLFGGDGNDIFGFSGTGQSGLGALSDIIVDFGQLAGDDDLIQLSAIDAMESTVGIDDAFTYIGQDAFTAEGQIRAFQSGTRTIIQINTSGADDAEMRMILENVTATSLSAADFIL